MKTKILVTGGSGFIGTNLIKLLIKKNFDVYVLENEKKIFIKEEKKLFSSINDIAKVYKFISKIKPDILVHLAWSKIPNFSPINNKYNFKIQKRFLKMIEKTEIKKIFISGTCLEYGNSFGKVKESSIVKNLQSFAYYKDRLRKYCFNILRKKKVVWGRVFYVYGKGQKKTSLINLVAKKNKIYLKEPFTFCDFIHVQDVCSAIIFLINSNYNRIINISSSFPVSVIDFCLIVKKVLNSKKILIQCNENGKIKGNWGDNFLLKKLGWRPVYQLTKGIRESIK